MAYGSYTDEILIEILFCIILTFKIKKVHTAYHNLLKLFQEIVGEPLVSGFGTKQPLQLKLLLLL